MEPMTFTDVLKLWPSPGELARDLDIPVGVVKQWRRRDSIPPERWQALVTAAHGHGHMHITTDFLASIAARRYAAARSAAA